MTCISENDQHTSEFLNSYTTGRQRDMTTSFVCLLRPLIYDGAITIYGCSGQGSFGCNDQNAV